MDTALDASSEDINAFIDGVDSDALGNASKKLIWTTWITLFSISVAALCVLFVVVYEIFTYQSIEPNPRQIKEELIELGHEN